MDKMGQELLVGLLIEVVHHLIIAARSIYFGDYAGLQLVHQLAEDDAVPQHVLIWDSWTKALPDNGFNPCLRLLFLLGLPLSCNLRAKQNYSTSSCK
jgi:hypothetical protein